MCSECCPKSTPMVTIEQVINMNPSPPVQPTMARRDLVDEQMARDERHDNMRMQLHRIKVAAKTISKTSDGAPNPRLRHYTPQK